MKSCHNHMAPPDFLSWQIFFHNVVLLRLITRVLYPFFLKRNAIVVSNRRPSSLDVSYYLSKKIGRYNLNFSRRKNIFKSVRGDRRAGDLKGCSPITFIAGIYFLGLRMACKCKINGKTLTLTFVCIDQIL